MYFSVQRYPQSPFHLRNFSKLSASCISGAQKPVLYSLSSIAIRCLSRSSRVLEGRPGLRWLFNSASSSSSLLRYLLQFSISQQHGSVSMRTVESKCVSFRSRWVQSLHSRRLGIELCAVLESRNHQYLPNRLVAVVHTQWLIGFRPRGGHFLEFLTPRTCPSEPLGVLAVLMQDPSLSLLL